ncbi:MAG: CHAT domain-containing protein [Marmoricola sp.]
MREQQMIDVADGRVTLIADPGVRVEVDPTRGAVQGGAGRSRVNVVATLRIAAGEGGGTLRLTPTASARGGLSVVVELEGELRLLAYAEDTASWTIEIAAGALLVVRLVEHPAGMAPEVVLIATESLARPDRGGVTRETPPSAPTTRGIPPSAPPMSPPTQWAPPPTLPPPETFEYETQVEPPFEAEYETQAEPDLVGASPDEAAPLQFAEVGASMPAFVLVDQPADVVVRLSRGEVRVEGGTSHDEQVIIVDPTQPVTVTLLRRGLALAGTQDEPESGQRELHLPAPGEADAELTFRLRAITVGEAEVQVVVRQEAPRPLATLRLTCTVLARGSSLPEQSSPATVASAVAAGVSPFLAPRTMTIDENLEGSTSVLTFDLVLPGVRERYEHLIADKPSVLSGVFQAIDDAWEGHKAIPNLRERSAAFQFDLRTIGARLASLALPPGLLTWLREHPDDLDELTILTSGETDIPWELVHTWEEVDGEDPDGQGFLGRAGLVRWVYNTPHPRDLSIRAGAAYHLVPEYADPELALPNAVLELDALARFGAQAITPSDGIALSRLLASGEVDLLHFAGHGRCDDTTDPPVREMLLADSVRHVGVTDAVPTDRSRTCWSLEDLREALPDRAPLALHDPGPLVVINACRLGRPPSRRSEAGGFAESFLRAGAGAFVGCLWSVGDEPARAFVEEFYARLDAGDTMARATIAARQQARRSGDLSWLAYTVYAHPDARLTGRSVATPIE